MEQISAIIFENPDEGFLIYLRDSAIDKPKIPFPDHWDLIGGHVEEGESFEQALEREVEEEIGLVAGVDYTYELYKVFECPADRDVYPNIKHIFHATLTKKLNQLTLTEGQRLAYVPAHELLAYKFANIIGDILKQYLIDTGRFR